MMIDCTGRDWACLTYRK